MWDWLFQFTDNLDRAGIPYALVGSVASSVYGEPRATNDVDVVIQLDRRDAARLITAFPADAFYVPPAEVIEIELGRDKGSHLNIIALETMAKADLYPVAAADREWFERRRELAVEGRRIWFAAPEWVIVNKLRFYREGGGEKHLRDIRGILEVGGDSIDRDEIARACERLGLAAEWTRISNQ